MKLTVIEDREQRINRTIDFVKSNLGEELSLAAMADMAAWSPYHFHRAFRCHVGETPAEFVRRVRLETAACLLKDQRLSVTEIAYTTGFTSPATFARAFRSAFGTSATVWRNRKTRKVIRKSGKASLPAAEYPPEKGGTTMKVETKTLEPMTIAYVRHVGPYEETTLTEAYDRLLAWASASESVAQEAAVLGISHSDPETTPPDRRIYDVAIEIDEGSRTRIPNGINVAELEGCRVACVSYAGPAEGIRDVYSTIYGDWLPKSGMTLSGRPPIEIHEPLRSVPEPGVHRLTICVPIE